MRRIAANIPERAVVNALRDCFYPEEKSGLLDSLIHQTNNVTLFKSQHQQIRYSNAWKKGDALRERYAAA